MIKNLPYMQIHYCFICYIVFFSAPLLLGIFPFSRFPVQYLLSTPKSLLCMPISYTNWSSTRGTARGARGGGGGWGTCVARMRLQPHTWCYPGVQFNLIAWYPIPGPSLVPVPVGDWGAELRELSMSGTLQQQFWCVRLPTLVLAKGFLLFSLPWLDSVERALLGLPSIALCPLK